MESKVEKQARHLGMTVEAYRERVEILRAQAEQLRQSPRDARKHCLSRFILPYLAAILTKTRFSRRRSLFLDRFLAEE
jgi:hypothetical protein